MGTRGSYGFRMNGQDKLTYNHYDSYPSELGVKIVEFLQRTSVEEIKSIFQKIVLVNETDILNDKQLKDLGIEKGNNDIDWYWALRASQGNLNMYKDVRYIYMTNNNKFIKDSLFCEWAYIINIDTLKLEVYKGLQNNPHNNRYTVNNYVYKSHSGTKYYPCKLIAEFSLDKVTVDDMLKLQKRFDKEEVV